MAETIYDAIVVGARCAGAPTAMLLARRGAAVLLVDRAAFPSDTISTHLLHPPGVASLARWGLRDRLVATGCPPIHSYAFDFGGVVIEGAPGDPPSPVAYAPRRVVLDRLLVDAAREAGVDVREEVTVDELLFDHGAVAGIRGRDRDGRAVVERGRVVVGADGIHSTVARAVQAPAYHEQAPLQAGYYSYWSGLPLGGRFEAYDRVDRVWAASPTHDDRTLVIVCWPIAEFEHNKQDVEGTFYAAFDRHPEFRDRIRAARREERFAGRAVPNYFRRPYGAGWVLVGDAGYNKDFITAQGISDAFRDAERAAGAIGAWLEGRRGWDDAMSAWHAERDAHALPMYDFTLKLARLAPPPLESQQLFAAMHGDPEAMTGFAQVVAGVRSPAEFFSEANVARIFAAAESRQPS